VWPTAWGVRGTDGGTLLTGGGAGTRRPGAAPAGAAVADVSATGDDDG
jgi:hypothetical protein